MLLKGFLRRLIRAGAPTRASGLKTIFKTSASGTSQDDLNKLENSLKAEIYRVASNASSQNNATYEAVALTNRINQLANLAISGATITGLTFAGEISATTGGFFGLSLSRGHHAFFHPSLRRHYHSN